MTDLCRISAFEVARLVRAGELTPREVLDHQQRRISALNPALRAFEALNLDLEVDGVVEPTSQLSGVALGIKDVIDTHDFPTTYGSPIFAGHFARQDAACVARARESGGIVVGKTVTCEFASFEPSATVNPWRSDRTPGGSSSGSAVAVAARMTPVAIGTQTAGSVIRPASYVGVVGYVPSPGTICRQGVFPSARTLDRVGVFGTCVSDAELLAHAITGHNHRSPRSYRASARRTNHGPLRVGFFASPPFSDVSPSMQELVHRVITICDGEGSTVFELPPLELSAESQDAHLDIMRVEMAAIHADLLRDHREAYGSHIRAFIESGYGITPADYARALGMRESYGAAFRALFREVDLIVAPSATGAAGPTSSTGDPAVNIPATLAGSPAVSLPGALDNDGLPLGIQLIGQRGDDARLLELAKQLEGALNFTARPGLPDDPCAPWQVKRHAAATFDEVH